VPHVCRFLVEGLGAVLWVVEQVVDVFMHQAGAPAQLGNRGARFGDGRALSEGEGTRAATVRQPT
jgi:hypothetical protein